MSATIIPFPLKPQNSPATSRSVPVHPGGGDRRFLGALRKIEELRTESRRHARSAAACPQNNHNPPNGFTPAEIAAIRQMLVEHKAIVAGCPVARRALGKD